MAQWVNRLRNNIFVNPPPLPLSCKISGALHLAQPGLADEIQVDFEIFKIGCRPTVAIIKYVSILNSRDWSEIVWLPEILRFKI